MFRVRLVVADRPNFLGGPSMSPRVFRLLRICSARLIGLSVALLPVFLPGPAGAQRRRSTRAPHEARQPSPPAFPRSVLGWTFGSSEDQARTECAAQGGRAEVVRNYVPYWTHLACVGADSPVPSYNATARLLFCTAGLCGLVVELDVPEGADPDIAFHDLLSTTESALGPLSHDTRHFRALRGGTVRVPELVDHTGHVSRVESVFESDDYLAVLAANSAASALPAFPAQVAGFAFGSGPDDARLACSRTGGEMTFDSVAPAGTSAFFCSRADAPLDSPAYYELHFCGRQLCGLGIHIYTSATRESALAAYRASLLRTYGRDVEAAMLASTGQRWQAVGTSGQHAFGWNCNGGEIAIEASTTNPAPHDLFIMYTSTTMNELRDRQPP